MHTRLLTALAGVLLAGCANQPVNRPAVSLAVLGARVWTGVPERPWAEALAVQGERIVAVGSNDDVRSLVRQGTRVVEAGGKLVVPGFIDSHVHFLEGGFRLTGVQLRDAASRREFTARIRQFTGGLPSGEWILGGDWDHETWGGELPHRQWIDAVTPNHPVWVKRLDGHMALANSVALRLAGVNRETPEVPGGAILRDARGNPTGILKDNAMALVERVIPAPSAESLDRALDAAMRHVAGHGVTSVHHMGSWEDLEVFERARNSGRLSTRIYAAVPLASWQRLSETVARRGRGDEWLRIGGLKGFVDGSLGSRTAAFLEPYSDAPKESGLFVNTPERLYEMISGADKAGLHLLIHAIGDRANRLLLDIFERVRREHGPRDRRFRIEHAQHLDAADIPRFAALGVIPSMQPYHAIDDGRWAERVIGRERCRTTYAFRALLDSGAKPAFGSDWFVAPPSPLKGIYAAVTRRTLDGKHPDGWVPEQRITVEEALRAYTRDAAAASFEEELKGTLEPGKLADFVLLDRDITRVAPDQIPQARVALTVAGGRVVSE